MGVRLETRHDVAVLYLQGSFFGDRDTERLNDTMSRLAAEGNQKVAIDLGGVRRMNSTALGVLVAMHKDYVRRGGRIVLANVDKSLENTLVITRLARLFEIGPTLPEALAKLGA